MIDKGTQRKTEDALFPALFSQARGALTTSYGLLLNRIGANTRKMHLISADRHEAGS
jgi:hypothetical protein